MKNPPFFEYGPKKKPPLKKRIFSDQTVDYQRVPLTRYLSTAHALHQPRLDVQQTGGKISGSDPWIRMA